MKRTLLHCALATLLIPVLAQGSREHGAHEHGVATINMALDQGILVIQLETPAANVVGFEYMPKTGNDKQTVADALAILENGQAMFGMDAEARCQQSSVSIESPMLSALDRDEHEHEHEHTHSDFDVTWEFVCASADRLTGVQVNLFDAFPGFETIDVNIVSTRGQGIAKLRHGSTMVEF